MKTFKKTIEKNRLVIKHDGNAISPREDSNAGYFITCERNHQSPDDNEELKSLIQNAGEESENADEHVRKIKEEMEHNGYGKVLYITPVHRYEHSGVLYKRGEKHGFDYSNCGFYIVTDKTLAEIASDKKMKTGELDKMIDAELEIYTKWMNGEVYGFILYDEKGEQEDSCWGFYDIEDIRENLPEEWKDEDLQDYLKD